MERPKDTKEVSPEQLMFLQDHWSTFLNERGQRVLNNLRDKYSNPQFDDNPYKMAYAMGQRDVVAAIEEVLEVREQDIKPMEEEKK